MEIIIEADGVSQYYYYEIEASGDVTLAGGFEVELGARFTVQRTSYK